MYTGVEGNYKAVEIRRIYRKWWKRWAGGPERVLTDGGKMFFDQFVQKGLDNNNNFGWNLEGPFF